MANVVRNSTISDMKDELKLLQGQCRTASGDGRKDLNARIENLKDEIEKEKIKQRNGARIPNPAPGKIVEMKMPDTNSSAAEAKQRTHPVSAASRF